jgi:hypothetical protein
MNEPEWTSEVRQEVWSLEMIFRWLEESAAFLYQIKAHSRPSRTSDSERMAAGGGLRPANARQ